MCAPPALRYLCAVVCVIGICAATDHDAGHDPDKRIELLEGLSIKVPQGNSTERLMSLEVDTNKSVGEARGKQKKLLQRILPMFLMPFLIQSMIIPMFLSVLKFMLFKSLMVGKVALLLIVLNAFKNHNAVKGRDAVMADIHYGYHGNGMEEYGAYLN